MFAGIVEEAAVVKALKESSSNCQIVIQSSLNHSKTKIGDSICIDGVCLTVVNIDGDELSFDVSEETLRKTAFRHLKSGQLVNLERSLIAGERIHGHLVSGHVDTVVRILSITTEKGSWKFEIENSQLVRPFLAQKGSVSISGISLTVGEVTDKSFFVYIIPHTFEVTSLKGKRVGDLLNLEVDMLARYAVGYLQQTKQADGTISEEFLIKYGYTN